MLKEKRLIDANAFQFEPDPVDNIMNGVLFMGRSTGKTLQMVKYCLQAMIDNAPTVDAVEVVHGRWLLPKESYGFVCSVCGGSCWYYDYDQTIGESNYCPNCGAKMDGERKDNGKSTSIE